MNKLEKVLLKVLLCIGTALGLYILIALTIELLVERR